MRGMPMTTTRGARFRMTRPSIIGPTTLEIMYPGYRQSGPCWKHECFPLQTICVRVIRERRLHGRQLRLSSVQEITTRVGPSFRPLGTATMSEQVMLETFTTLRPLQMTALMLIARQVTTGVGKCRRPCRPLLQSLLHYPASQSPFPLLPRNAILNTGGHSHLPVLPSSR